MRVGFTARANFRRQIGGVEMRYVLVIAIIISFAALSGCGQKDLEKKVAENTGGINKLEREVPDRIKEVTGRVDAVESDLVKEIASIQDSLDEVKEALKNLSGGKVDLTNTSNPSIREQEITQLKEQVATLQETVASLKAELQQVKTSVSESSGVAVENPRIDWEEMAIPEKLGEKLDAFVTAYAPKLDESGRRSEFETDIAAYRQEATKEYTSEELLDKYKSTLQQQLDEAKDDRMKEWYRRQMDALEQADERALEARLKNYRRFQNMRDLSDIARKYDISREDLRKYGLQIYGGGYRSTESRDN